MNNDEPGRRRRRRSELLCRKSHKTFLLNSLFGGDTLQDDAAFKTKRRFLSSFLLQVSRSVCVMTTQLICKLLRSKEASAAVDVRTWPPVMDTGTSHTQVLLCRCVDLLKTQLIVCLFSLQMICQRRNLLCCINRPTPTRWPTWTSASPPPACSLELRYT